MGSKRMSMAGLLLLYERHEGQRRAWLLLNDRRRCPCLATSQATRGDLPTRIGCTRASSSPAREAREAGPGAAREDGRVPRDQGAREGCEAPAKGDAGLRGRCLRLQPEEPR